MDIDQSVNSSSLKKLQRPDTLSAHTKIFVEILEKMDLFNNLHPYHKELLALQVKQLLKTFK